MMMMTTASSRSEPMASARRWVAILALALCGALVAGLVLVAASFPFSVSRSARVEGQAMSPTLRDQDRLLVNKSRLPQRSGRSAVTS